MGSTECITTERIKAVAKSLGAIYCETSVLTMSSIHDCFSFAVSKFVLITTDVFSQNHLVLFGKNYFTLQGRAEHIDSIADCWICMIEDLTFSVQSS